MTSAALSPALACKFRGIGRSPAAPPALRSILLLPLSSACTLSNDVKHTMKGNLSMTPFDRLTAARAALTAAQAEYEAALDAAGKADPTTTVVASAFITFLCENAKPKGENDAAYFDGAVLIDGKECTFKLSCFLDYLKGRGFTIPMTKVTSILRDHMKIKALGNTHVALRQTRPYVFNMERCENGQIPA